MAAPTKATAEQQYVKIRILSTFATVDGVRVTRGQIVEASKAEADRLIAIHDNYLQQLGAGKLGGGNPYHGAVLEGARVKKPSNLSATDLELTGDFANDPDDE